MQILIIVHLYGILAKKSINKIENIQKRTLGFLQYDYSSDYETLLKKLTNALWKLNN